MSCFSYFSRGPANTNLVVLCGCKGTALFMSPPMTDCGEIEWWSLHWAMSEWVENSVNRQLTLQNPTLQSPKTTPLEILTLSKREWLFIFLICVWESEDRLIPCGVLWIWWGGIRSRRRNNDNKERKKRKKERTKKKNIAKAGRNIHKNKAKTSKDEGRTTSYWRYFIVYQHHNHHHVHVHHHCHPDPSCLVVQQHHHRQRPLRQQWSLNWKKKQAWTEPVLIRLRVDERLNAWNSFYSEFI